MKTTGTPDYYYLHIRMTETDKEYHDVVIKYEDIPNSDYKPFSADNYASYTLAVYEAYIKANIYYYYSLYAVYGNYHTLISEAWSDSENPIFYDNHSEVKRFMELAKIK